jgi:hypothetical protein
MTTMSTSGTDKASQTRKARPRKTLHAAGLVVLALAVFLALPSIAPADARVAYSSGAFTGTSTPLSNLNVTADLSATAWFASTPGSLVAWGWNADEQTNVPDGTDFVAIATGRYHSLALKSDGSLVAWGNNDKGQTNVPGGTDFVAIAAGEYHSLALKSDGSLVAWGVSDGGEQDNGQVTDVPGGTDFVAIAGGFRHCLALEGAATHTITASAGPGHHQLQHRGAHLHNRPRLRGPHRLRGQQRL